MHPLTQYGIAIQDGMELTREVLPDRLDCVDKVYVVVEEEDENTNNTDMNHCLHSSTDYHSHNTVI